ncbi:MAG: Two-component response regulator [Rickettsiales bacterium]|jgi:two-component system OmpR family response regulator|nr:Two-component response regulator [Rickettsiales bacterium]
MKLLIVEDDKQIATQLANYVKEYGFVPHVEHDGVDGHYEGEEGVYDAVLLDLGLPGMDGLSILQKWRKAGKTMPVILLTARDSKMEVVRGLDAGADDYITKPFDLEEVVARLHSHLRRVNAKNQPILSYKNVTLDTRMGRVSVDKLYVKLTRTEYLMLQYLFMNQGRPISINELVEHTYEDFDNDSGIIARHIANIRKKIGADIVQTEANRGYYVPLETK